MHRQDAPVTEIPDTAVDSERQNDAMSTSTEPALEVHPHDDHKDLQRLKRRTHASQIKNSLYKLHSNASPGVLAAPHKSAEHGCSWGMDWAHATRPETLACQLKTLKQPQPRSSREDACAKGSMRIAFNSAIVSISIDRHCWMVPTIEPNGQQCMHTRMTVGLDKFGRLPPQNPSVLYCGGGFATAFTTAQFQLPLNVPTTAGSAAKALSTYLVANPIRDYNPLLGPSHDRAFDVIPPSFLCPLTRELMQFPVRLPVNPHPHTSEPSCCFTVPPPPICVKRSQGWMGRRAKDLP